MAEQGDDGCVSYWLPRPEDASLTPRDLAMHMQDLANRLGVDKSEDKISPVEPGRHGGLAVCFSAACGSCGRGLISAVQPIRPGALCWECFDWDAVRL